MLLILIFLGVSKMPTRSLIAVISLLLLSSGAIRLAAQTGPWTDGELIIRSYDPVTFAQTVYRMAPETGDGEPLLTDIYWGGWAGSLVFDPYRNGLLGQFGMAPDSLQLARLYLIDSSGGTSIIPGLAGITLRALCPVGDGRVYFQRRTNTAPHTTEYLTAGNEIRVLMDQSGLAPLDLYFEHAIYDAPTNSLLVTTSGWWDSSTTGCTNTESTISRIPLSTDGSRVAGPIACMSVANVSNNIMSITPMPNSTNYMLCLAGSNGFDETLRILNPATLTTTPWARPSPQDLDGGFWSARLNKAIILDDGSNNLRAYSPGEVGAGTIITADVPVSAGSSGFSPGEAMIRLDLQNASACTATVTELGPGTPSAGNIFPLLEIIGCPSIGKTCSVGLARLRPGTQGLLAIGTNAITQPLAGGTLYVDPLLALIPITVLSNSNYNGRGYINLPFSFPNPALAGLTLTLQAAFDDYWNPSGLTLTNGVSVTIGQ